MTPRERFNNLPVDVRELVLDKHRDWNVSHDWWDSVEDLFKEDMDNLGIMVGRMYFSGFWSQGDGACFEGYVANWDLFLRSIGITDAALIKLASDNWSCSVEHSGHYYHENCTRFDFALVMPENADDETFAGLYSPYPDDSLQTTVWMVNLAQHDSDFEDLCRDAFRDHMRDLYKRLEEEYDALTSDEAILDSLDANDQLEEAINDAIMESEDA